MTSSKTEGETRDQSVEAVNEEWETKGAEIGHGSFSQRCA